LHHNSIVETHGNIGDGVLKDDRYFGELIRKLDYLLRRL